MYSFVNIFIKEMRDNNINNDIVLLCVLMQDITFILPLHKNRILILANLPVCPMTEWTSC